MLINVIALFRDEKLGHTLQQRVLKQSLVAFFLEEPSKRSATASNRQRSCCKPDNLGLWEIYCPFNHLNDRVLGSWLEGRHYSYAHESVFYVCRPFSLGPILWPCSYGRYSQVSRTCGGVLYNCMTSGRQQATKAFFSYALKRTSLGDDLSRVSALECQFL